MAAALSFGSALSTGFKAPVAPRSAPVARAGLKVYARMTKDRVGLEKDAKWRQTIDIYPVSSRPSPAFLPAIFSRQNTLHKTISAHR